MANLLVGIFESCTPAELEAALGKDGIDTSRLKVVTRDARSDAHDNSVLDFVFAGDSLEVDSPAEDMTHGTGMLSDSGGTSVPGLSAPSATLVGFGSHLTANYLAGFAIPQDEVGNFNDAVNAGRCVVVYSLAPNENADTLKGSFKAAGLRNVRTY